VSPLSVNETRPENSLDVLSVELACSVKVIWIMCLHLLNKH
jgi:hypothetical protein